MIDAGSFDDLEALLYFITCDEVDVECLLFLHHVGFLSAEKYTVINIRVLPSVHKAAHIIPTSFEPLAVLAITAAHTEF